MRIGVHAQSGAQAAEIYARGLTHGLQRRLLPDDKLFEFDGLRVELFSERKKRLSAPTLRELEPQPNAGSIGRVSMGFVSHYFAGLFSERAHARYIRGVDVSHSIGCAPPPSVAGGAVVPLLADLSALSKPRWHDCSETRQLERFLHQIDQFPMLTTVSDFTRAEVAALSGLDPRRIAVIAPGVDELFYEASRAEDELELQAIGLLPRQFFLYVGSVDEQANLSTLLQAYAALPERVKAWLPLVLAGGRGRGCTLCVPVAAQRDVDSGNIRFLGRVPRFLLRILYGHARLTLFPSTMGGFGLALAEALACGAPVAVSRGSALADMAGPLALQIEAEDVWQWRDILSDQIDRGAHAACAVQRAKFSWDRAAEQAMLVYEHIVGARRTAA